MKSEAQRKSLMQRFIGLHFIEKGKPAEFLGLLASVQRICETIFNLQVKTQWQAFNGKYFPPRVPSKSFQNSLEQRNVSGGLQINNERSSVQLQYALVEFRYFAIGSRARISAIFVPLERDIAKTGSAFAFSRSCVRNGQHAIRERELSAGKSIECWTLKGCNNEIESSPRENDTER